MRELQKVNIWFWLKIIAAMYQIPASWHVFHNVSVQAGRSPFLAFLTTALAILLMDVLFIAVLMRLEDKSIEPIERMPWAIVALSLLIANLGIGYYEEGLLAFAPRLGLIGLVAADAAVFTAQFVQHYYNNAAREQHMQTRRERRELALRNAQAIERKELMYKEWRKGVKTLRMDIRQLQIDREKKQLGLGVIELAEVKVTSEPVKTKAEPNTFAKVVSHGNGYAWYDSEGKIHTTTVTGKTYTEKGARRAASRHFSVNGA